ncbi:double-strand break repair helicase AddA [Novosphingobium lentum]|uniref:double-strand break repair helicase AddA n=1 Tax=Novosphingobium lentum TaxID=145287 RepID=UPI0009FDEB9E|nr:double-strand break repair helicase AddA [Novosphingobium lentum]
MAGAQPWQRRGGGRRAISKVFPLQGNQQPAVDPERTVWLSASAGTGKTQVLSARVLRLLLQPGVRPEQILCLTFTKAGAAEMATRVNDVLAKWVRLPDTELASDLMAIGAAHGPETLARARSRFAAVLDCPGGGLRIGTIHAFSQWLLSAFPVEAGLTPGTRAMEDRDRDLLLRRVLADMLVEAEAHGDATLLDTLATMSLRMAQDQVVGFLSRCAAAQELWTGPGAWTPPLRARINGVLGIGPDEDEAALAALCADDAFDSASLRRCHATLAAWDTKTGREGAEAISAWLPLDSAARFACLDVLQSGLFTKGEGLPKQLTNVLKRDPDYGEYISRIAASLDKIRERRALLALADILDGALTLGRRFALAWDAAKQREGFIDFDDQIRCAANLLSRSDLGEWVRYKLDRRFDHILVDEAQDTNEAQWRIILEGLAADFFAGEGQHGDALRTLFVVGDYKQAIFRFQGTSPENFEAARKRVEAQLGALAQVLGDPSRDLLGLGLGQSYRTASPILGFVDKAIEHIGADRFGLPLPPEAHVGEDRPGTVALWKAVGLAADEADDDDEAGPPGEEDDGAESWLSRPDRILADKIARQVRGWIDVGFPLAKGGARLATAGDVMVLVRKRKELAGLIVARLHAAGVAVAGVDRLRLGAPLAVKDLVAGLRFAAQPLDDLNLAGLLVSPLIGWSQDQLLEHGYRDGKVRLWEHLRAAEGPQTREAMDALRSILRRADYDPPQVLLHWLLVGPLQGRRKLVARLGHEANDPIDELLNAALAYAATATPSLVGFLQWFDAGEGELKREPGAGAGMVRVMTVHGAKGLQAPIVILADAADDPDASPTRGLTVTENILGERRTVPLPPLKKAERVGPVRDAEALAAKEDRAEHWRLLYVAMTRAEEALFIAGALGKRRKDLPPESWYAMLEPLFDDDGWQPDALWDGRKQIGGPAPRPDVNPVATPPETIALPGWIETPVGPEPRPPRPLAPSSLGEEQAPDPPLPPGVMQLAARRGVLIHRLLERLPEVDPAQRQAAASAWLARSAADLDAPTRDEIAAAALGVLGTEAWRDLFSPDALAEVSIAALVEGRMVTGTIDRLLIGADTIRIVDFKTARRPPMSLEAIPASSLRQMAAYAAALRVIHPDKRIEAALLYTQLPQLFVLPDALLDAQTINWIGGSGGETASAQDAVPAGTAKL